MALSDSQTGPPPFPAAFGDAIPANPDPPPLAADRLPYMPCSLPRWTGTGAWWLLLWRAPAPGSLPARTAFPVRQTGSRRRRFHFRGLLKLPHPPFVGCIARLRPNRFPTRTLASYQVLPTIT